MIGGRIRQARISAGMTQDQVVRKLREAGTALTKAGLSKYELGKSTPKASVLRALCAVLDVNPDYFLRKPELSIKWLAFRKLTSLGKTKQQRVKDSAVETANSQVRLHELLFPDTPPQFPKKRKVSTMDEAEATAELLRRKWKLGTATLESVTEIFEDHGGIVVECSEENKKFDGLSGWVDGRYPIAVVSSEASADRKRFNLAHELGHLLMDCSGVDEKAEEKLAHRFAAAFIVPREVAIQELGARRRNLGIGELGILKRKHGLSMQAWVYRACDLGIVDKALFARVFKVFSKQGWRKAEPVNFRGEEKPIRLRQMTIRALAEGLITPEEAEKMCPDVIRRNEEKARRRPRGYVTASSVRALPEAERKRLLEKVVSAAGSMYEAGGELTDFEAFTGGQED